MVHKKLNFTLPKSIISPTDLSQLIRELDEADQALLQGSLRKGGEETKIPRLSRLLSEVVEMNRLNLLREADRLQLSTQLTNLRSEAPTMHISFNADPSPVFLQKLTTWIRDEIHPYVLIQIGLLPNIGAGCVLRTNSQVFDFSLKDRFDKNRQTLIDELRKLEPAT